MTSSLSDPTLNRKKRQKLIKQKYDEISEQLNEIKKKYALDQPVFIQFLYYINDLSFISVLENNNKDNYTYAKQNKYKYFKIFDIGSKSIVVKKPYLRESYFKKGESVSSIILSTFPNTVVLATSSMLLASFLGIILGILCAVFINTFFDRLIIFLTAIGISLPSFFSAMLFAWIFGFIAVLYNPIIPIHLYDKQIWIIVNLITGILFFFKRKI